MAQNIDRKKAHVTWNRTRVILAGVVTGIVISLGIGLLTQQLIIGVLLAGPLGIVTATIAELVIFRGETRTRHYF